MEKPMSLHPGLQSSRSNEKNEQVHGPRLWYNLVDRLPWHNSIEDDARTDRFHPSVVLWSRDSAWRRQPHANFCRNKGQPNLSAHRNSLLAFLSSNYYLALIFKGVPIQEAVEQLVKLSKVELKNAVTDVIVEELTPIQTRLAELESSELVQNALSAGARLANRVASQNLRKIREAIGLHCY